MNFSIKTDEFRIFKMVILLQMSRDPVPVDPQLWPGQGQVGTGLVADDKPRADLTVLQDESTASAQRGHLRPPRL